jgi:nitrogen fixation/metabolism regulation signal transduction histidine kinase
MSQAPPVKYKRSIRNYLLDARFQLKWTGFIIIVALAVSAIMGVFLYRTSSDVTRESQKVIDQGKELIKESKTNSDLVAIQIQKDADSPQLSAVYEKEAKERADKLDAQHKALLAQQQATLDQQRTMLLALVAGLTLLVILIGLLGIYFTHKVVGPIYKMKQLLKQVGDGKLNFQGRLRKGDELQDFFEVFAAMVEKLKDRQRKEVELLTDAISDTKRDSIEGKEKDEALAKIISVRDEMKAALEL